MRLLGLNTSHNQSSYDAGYTNEDEAELITTSNVKYIANHNGADTGSDLTDKKIVPKISPCDLKPNISAIIGESRVNKPPCAKPYKAVKRYSIQTSLAASSQSIATDNTIRSAIIESLLPILSPALPITKRPIILAPPIVARKFVAVAGEIPRSTACG
jgi:hypothetical protein